MLMRSRTTVLTGSFLAITLAATASACSGVRARPADAPDGSRTRVITAAMIEASGASSAWDALLLLVRNAQFTEDGYGNPQRIRRRGASTVHLLEDMPILVDNVRVTDLLVLEKMPAREITRIRVLNGIDATTYYGTGATDGVILIDTKGGA